MKRFLLSMLLITSFISAFAQNSSQDIVNFRKSDIVIDPFWLIAGLAVNASYERILSEDSGIGANAIFGFNNDLDDFTQISPYYRAYFGSKYASGFFIEGFVPITVRKEYENEAWDDNRGDMKTYTTGGIGFGLGGKWVAKKKFVFELSLGVARKVVGNEGSGEPVTGKGMIGVGFAF